MQRPSGSPQSDFDPAPLDHHRPGTGCLVDDTRPLAHDQPVDLEPRQFEELLAHDWPGNVRELRNVVERTLLLGRLPAESLPKPAPRRAQPPEYPLDWTLEQVKQHHMARVLEDSGGNKSAAARRLDISRKTLERKLGAASPE